MPTTAAAYTVDPTLGAQRVTTNGMEALTSEDFFEVLIAELQQQDPFKPSDTSEMVGQISQIRTIELSSQLTDALSDLSTQQHTTGAAELIGKLIAATLEAEDGSTSEVTGVVTGVRFEENGAVLELDTGEAVPLADVTHITAASPAVAGTGREAVAEQQSLLEKLLGPRETARPAEAQPSLRTLFERILGG